MIKLLLIVLLVFILFGAGKLPTVMADIGKGLRNLRQALQGEEDEKDHPASTASKIIEHEDKPSKKS